MTGSITEAGALVSQQQGGQRPQQGQEKPSIF
jgi:hypothetical protein